MPTLQSVAAAEVVQLTTTAGSPEDAARLAEALLRPRLAACVQVVGPVQSRYWWQGRLESATEWLCIAKTTRAQADAAVAAVRAAHRDEVPEVLVTAVVGGHGAYLDWVAAESGAADLEHRRRP